LATTTSAAPATVPATAVATSRVAATTPPATTAASLTTDGAAQQILEVQNAYRAAMDAIASASANPVRPDSPSLNATLAGEYLTFWHERLAQRERAGQATRRGPDGLANISFLVVSVESEAGLQVARIRLCDVDDFIVFEVGSGAIVNGEISTELAEARMEVQDGVWKLVARAPVWTKAGVQTCDG